ncbi:MAG: hypothetical protein MI866_10660, partial [Bacteroidales bacterium]|nr:hypothetical protein [Bacteroidales bacterium]
TENYEEMTSDATNTGRKHHLTAKTTVRTTTSIFTSGKLITQLPEMSLELVKKMAKEQFFKKIDDLSDVADGVLDQFRKKLKALPDGGEKLLDDFKELTDAESLRKLIDNPDFVDNWKMLDGLGEDVIPSSLRKNPDFINKFDNVVKNNNLGLGSDGLSDLLKSPSTKLDAATGQPLKWDNPDGVLDGVKRASDANIEGLTVTHKKFPAPADGTDNFVLKNAKQYQAEASLDAGLSFEKGGVSFDNVDDAGKLIDRKYGHSSIFDDAGNVVDQNRTKSILEQARRQLNAADGTPVKWEISTLKGAEDIQDFFDLNRIDIEVVYKAQKTIIK